MISESVESSLDGLSSSRRPLTLLQLILLNAIVCGLEFCSSAGFTYIPPMLLKSGIEEEHMSIVLGMGPLVALFVVPIIGRESDRCHSRFGRRRPFILILSLLLIVSLIIIPYGEIVSAYFLSQEMSKSFGIFLLILGAVMLDFCSQACLTPCEALLSDATRNSNQQERCFTIYSFMVSLGGCIGYLITALDWSSSSVGLYFGGQEQSAFSLLILLFTFSMIATLCIAEERPADHILVSAHGAIESIPFDIDEKVDQIHQALLQHDDENSVPSYDPGYESGSNQADDTLHSNSDGRSEHLPNGNHKSNIERSSLETVEENAISISLERQDSSIVRFRTRNPITFVVKMLLQKIIFAFRLNVVFSYIRKQLYSNTPLVIYNIVHMPEILKRLAIANFFSWTAVMCFNLFYTDYVGQAVYGGNPNAPEDSHLRMLYDDGVRMGSWGLLLHCITSAMYVAFIEKLTNSYGPRTTYMIGMASFCASMFAMLVMRTIVFVNIMASLTGFAYATVTTVPFTLLNQYHGNKEVFFFDRLKEQDSNTNRSSQQSHHPGIGSDMATLDSAFFSSQILLSSFMGYMVSWTGSVTTYIIVSAIAGVGACFSISRIIQCTQEAVAFSKNKSPLVRHGLVMKQLSR